MTTPPDPTTLRHARRLADLSQHQLATQLGVTQVTVHYWETGRRTPSPRAIQRLTELLPLQAADAPTPDSPWLTIADAAQRAGVTRRAIYLALRTGRLPSRDPQRPFLICATDLVAWQAQRRRRPPS